MTTENLSNWEIMQLRECAGCMFLDRKAASQNKKAHDEEDWNSQVSWCTFAFGLNLTPEGKCLTRRLH